MSLILRKINAFAKKVSSLPPKPGGTMPVADLQAQFDAAPEELRAALNGAIDDIIADYATKAELSGIQLGQITDGTVTPAKLSFDPATQAELNAHTGATTGIHGATSAATANTLAFRDANGRLQVAAPSVTADAATKGYADGIITGLSKIMQGSYTGDGSMGPRFINVGFTPKIVIISGQTSSTPGYATSTFTSTYRLTTNNVALSANNNLTTNGFNVGDVYTNANTYTFGWTAWG